MLPVMLAGCVAGFVYDRLDMAASWYVGRYVSLDKTQDLLLRSSVVSALEGNGENPFGRFGRLLDELEKDSRGPIAVQTLQLRWDEMSESWDELVARLAPHAVPVLATLRPAQIEELFANIEEDNAEYAEEYAGDDFMDRNLKRQRTALKSVQRFTGKLDKNQRALIHARLARMSDLVLRWLAHRRTWQAHLRTLIQQRPAPTDFARQLQALLRDGNQFDDADYRAAAQENRRQMLLMGADLSKTLTGSQRRHFGARIRRYADMLDKLGRRSVQAKS